MTAVAAFAEPPEGATDHEIAEGIRDGRFSSPQKVGEFWLFALRVTGTGAAWRDSLDEWAFRDPKVWLTDEMLERAASVPVIFNHPEGRGLNSDEYRERSIGNAVLSYIQGDELWCVAKIFDADAALAMQTTHRSTSPGVTPPKGSIATETNDGTKVLAEELPLILDHLAVCEAGVWDKDGPPDGIRLDARKDASVTEEEKKALEKERDDAKMRADAAEAELAEMKKADAAKKDETGREAIAKNEKEGEAEADPKADKAKKDAADKKKDARKDRHAKHDGDVMDCAKCDSEETEEAEKAAKDAKKDATMTAAKDPVDANRGTDKFADSKTVAEMQETIKRQQERIDAMTTQPTIEDANAIAKAWGRWDSLYQALNEQTPRAYPGEKPRAYLRRLADGVRRHTTSFQNYVFHDAQQTIDFDLVADKIFDEALAASKKPAMNQPGVMREIVTHPHGKTRVEFIGDHKAPWLPFTHPTKFAVTRINRPTGNVYS